MSSESIESEPEQVAEAASPPVEHETERDGSGMSHATLTAAATRMARDRGSFLEEPLDTTLSGLMTR